jgi:leucyl/phenylalanyl-tRNA--protein transferase
MIPWLEPGDPFPPVEAALTRPNGLLAAGADLTAERLLVAYRRGIFPWYSQGEPVLWWSPDPRMVLFTGEFRIARSLRKRLRAAARGELGELRVDTAFEAVMRACAEPRPGQDGTWITGPMLQAYAELHRRGHAHSIELWCDGRLAGGLYGVAIGRMFYGESMFARSPDASKIALAALVRILLSEGVAMIDCQQNTRHLASLGAREIPRADFVAHVVQATRQPPIDWSRYTAGTANPLLDFDERATD